MGKTSILINLPGSINYGFFSPERGESRWSMNLAYILGTKYKDKFDVYAWSTRRPSMGNKADSLKEWSGVFLGEDEVFKYRDNRVFDIVFDTSWYHPGMTNKYKLLRAKSYIHGHWGGCCLDEPNRYPDSSHIIAYPNMQVTSSMMSCSYRHIGRHLMIPMPMIYGIELIPTNNKDFIWSVRECFYSRKSKDEKDRALKVLRVAVKLLREVATSSKLYVFDYYLNFTTASREYHNLDKDYVREANVVLDTVKDRICAVENLPYDETINLLGTSSILLRTGQPPGAPMEFEAISRGCLPVTWNTLFERYFSAVGLTMDPNDSDDVMFDKMNIMYGDINIRNSLLKMCYSELSIHYDYDFIVSQLLSVLR